MGLLVGGAYHSAFPIPGYRKPTQIGQKHKWEFTGSLNCKVKSVRRFRLITYSNDLPRICLSPLFWHHHLCIGVLLRQALSVLWQRQPRAAPYLCSTTQVTGAAKDCLFPRIPAKLLGLLLVGSTLVKCLSMS